MRPRHLFAALMLIGQIPILAPFVAAWLISAVVCGVVAAAGHVHRHLRVIRARAGERLHGFAPRRRRPPRTGRPALGW
jgi:hypothetical protein